MCVGIPMQVEAVNGIAAHATDGCARHLIDLSLTGPVAPGTWVLVHLGTAREVLEAHEAHLIRLALDGLAAVMAGHGPGRAFADLEAREPALPPHLQAAREAGRSTG